MTIKHLIECPALSGKASFGPYHYAIAANTDWESARIALRRYAELGALIALRNGMYRIAGPKSNSSSTTMQRGSK